MNEANNDTAEHEIPIPWLLNYQRKAIFSFNAENFKTSFVQSFFSNLLKFGLVPVL